LPIDGVHIIDSRKNHFEERENDTSQQASPKDSLEVLIRLITRSKTKKIQEELVVLIIDIWVNKLLIYQTRYLCTIWDISRSIC
jgi:hypothetical protein